MNFFAIGDIHGSLKKLTELHKKIFNHENFNKNEDTLVYLGDYIDRGLNSKYVIDEMLKVKKNGFNTKYLLGNHESILIDFLFNKKNNIKNWLEYGADHTFKSYDVEIVEFIKDGFNDSIIDKLRETFLTKISDDHINFFKNLKLKFETEKYLFVHAGIDPIKNLKDQIKKDYLWSRSDIFFNKNFTAEKVIVHGHTPEQNIVDYPFRINIDTGCFFSGKLSCVCLNDKNNQRIFIETV